MATKMKMVKKAGKMVPAFAADGKGKMSMGGKTGDEKMVSKSRTRNTIGGGTKSVTLLGEKGGKNGRDVTRYTTKRDKDGYITKTKVVSNTGTLKRNVNMNEKINPKKAYPEDFKKKGGMVKKIMKSKKK